MEFKKLQEDYENAVRYKIFSSYALRIFFKQLNGGLNATNISGHINVTEFSKGSTLPNSKRAKRDERAETIYSTKASYAATLEADTNLSVDKANEIIKEAAKAAETTLNISVSNVDTESELL